MRRSLAEPWLGCQRHIRFTSGASELDQPVSASIPNLHTGGMEGLDKHTKLGLLHVRAGMAFENMNVTNHHI